MWNVEVVGVSEFETRTAAMPRIMKLYGQIRPKTKSGGCHGGRFSDEYQPGELLVQIPEPSAYMTTRIIPIAAATVLNSMARD